MLKAVELAKSNGTKQVLLSVHTLSNLSGIIQTTLGAPVLKRFTKERLAQIDDVTVHLETERIKSAFVRGVIFTPFISTKRLAELQNDYRATDIVYVPWAPKELESYKTNHKGSVQI
jgi:hypothetical protein